MCAAKCLKSWAAPSTSFCPRQPRARHLRRPVGLQDQLLRPGASRLAMACAMWCLVTFVILGFMLLKQAAVGYNRNLQYATCALVALMRRMMQHVTRQFACVHQQSKLLLRAATRRSWWDRVLQIAQLICRQCRAPGNELNCCCS